MRRRGPLADSYPAAVALVICALVPFLTLTAAVLPLLPQLSKSLGLSKSALEVTIALSDAGYAFGTVLAVQFAVHLPRRRMLLGYVTAFVVAAMLAAWAPSGPVFAAAFVIEGLCTSLMLIAAVPPLAAGDWRPLFWVVAGVGVVALLFALLTYEDEPADDRSAPWDFVALALAGFGCAVAFFGAAQLEVGGPKPGSLVPLLVGIAMICALVVHQYRSRHPLMPVRQRHRGAVRSAVPHPVHPGARRLRPRGAHRRGGAARRRGHRRRSAGGGWLGAHRLRRRRLGVACAVHRRVLAALVADPADLRPGGTAPRGNRVSRRSCPALPGYRDRSQPGRR
jgi:hypothetical protein